MKCKACNDETNQIKAGKTKAGTQKYKCKICGKYYTKEGTGENWYYSFKYCKNLYKTEDGKIYIFNKQKINWEVSDETYSNLMYYSNYKKIDRVPYLCGVLFWDNTKNIYYSDNLGCGGRLGMNSSEIIIKAEKFDDRVEITSAVGYSSVEDTIYKHHDFKEKVSDKINVSIDELEAFVRNNPSKFYNYKYTFKLNDNGFYNYYSIERVN